MNRGAAALSFAATCAAFSWLAANAHGQPSPVSTFAPPATASPAPTSPPPSDCIDDILVSPSGPDNVTTYVTLPRHVAAHVRVTLYTAKNAYRLEVARYVNPIRVAQPPDGPVLMYRDQSYLVGQSSRACPSELTAMSQRFQNPPSSDAIALEPLGAFDRPTCGIPYSPVKLVKAAPIEYPEVYRTQGIAGTATVRVRLHASGAIAAATVYRSSGEAALDNETIRAARASTYAPEIVDCEPVAGEYLFVAEFSKP